jgi:hypothetical protein
MNQTILLLFLFLQAFSVQGQSLTQTVYGNVMDRDSRQPVIGATATIIEGGRPVSVLSDSAGRFIFSGVPVGRVRILFSSIGFNPFTTDYLLVNTAKALELQVELEEKHQKEEGVVVKARRSPKQPVNRFALASGRSFSAEETQRFAASANDPARMAVGFPGVQATRDTRSDIIIRGNNPAGMQWRIEDVDVINPNHFARKGSTGGGITILSLSMLDNSDFLTGAMPAEYGDVLSGVFDMHLRKGNDQKRENTIKLGMIGLDYSTEGPIVKGSSSYLVNYRYSTLGLLSAIGLNLVGERETNTFQDLAFNLSFSNKPKTFQWNIWGMGGISKETYEAVEDTLEWKQYDDYAVYDFHTKMGATGIGATWKTSSRSFLRSSLVLTAQDISYVDDTLTRNNVPSMVNDEQYQNGRLSFTTSFNHKFNAAVSLKTGITLTNLFYSFEQTKLNFSTGKYFKPIDGSGNSLLMQPYVQLSLKPGRWTINPGIQYIQFGLNGTRGVDPRLSVQYHFVKGPAITLAYGKHSKVLPIGNYFYRDPVSWTLYQS